MLDLSGFDFKKFAEAGIELQLINPVDGKPLEAFISIKGEDSSEWREALLTNAKAVNPEVDQSADDQQRKMAFSLAAITTGWSGISEKEEAIEYSKDAAMALYFQYDWIANQVYIALRDRERFLVNA